MEQRRIVGKSHWYHETQSSTYPQDVLPLVPEAAHVDDCFLLDLAIPHDVLLPFQSWLTPARKLAQLLFPAHVVLDRMHTFSAYERMSTALTVAQVYGVQRLCNHYAARLTPLPGPDSSRESNHRLAQITQYARQLASSPAVIGERDRQHLDAVGLTSCDSILMNQIIGFVGFQARVVALLQACSAHPVRRIPGLDIQQFAHASPFSATNASWHAAPLEPEQLHTRAKPRADYPNELHALLPLLAHSPAVLDLLGSLISSTLRSDMPTRAFSLTTLMTSRINGSVSCFNEHAHTAYELTDIITVLRQDERELQRWEQRHPVERVTLQAVQWLTRAPDRFSAALLTPLFDQGISSEQAINLLAWSGLCGWLNRLKIALGETY
ncbi:MULTISPECIES: carboxymuconolactone decarboxylase family protein [Citrobacter]|uniref:carboxymuconolactone decarboxylase family protein n=1 Tax=Citrobacter TaxID=544 RepID=UPI0008474D17|nr:MULTISPECIES: carboxymuconolactone decarboxylase family protein [Citrobacter]MBQ4925725.1 CMD domain-containing protein [Citrobacter werkmanii]MBQ4937851.1 CMD domain-containing protein [Citrobacter werkmanii]MBQ4950693.1 CMD domain-containing protein [Citrobacter werkmanii]MBQ4966692.1 CMD domain-containing protein [Citrobacter werkmanii]MDM3295790.1 CMD domain-containing protein [Citrobacter sp. Cc139]